MKCNYNGKEQIGGRVLIVEDDPFILDLLKKLEEITQRIRPTVRHVLEKRQLGLKNQGLMRAVDETNASLETCVKKPTAELIDAN